MDKALSDLTNQIKDHEGEAERDFANKSAAEVEAFNRSVATLQKLNDAPKSFQSGGRRRRQGRETNDPVAGCPATGLLLTVNVYETGMTNPVYIAQANLGIIQPTPDSCHVTYTPTTGAGGFTASVTITNTGTAAISGWTLGFTFPGDQKVTHGWNATVTQTDTSVTAANLAYNATIAPGASQSLGFQGTWAASDAPPATFAVNGELCY